MLSSPSTIRLYRRERPVLYALGLAVLVIGVEYVARRFLLYWFPALGSWGTNDMVAAAVAYGGLVWLTLPSAQRGVGTLASAVRAIAGQARCWHVWAAAVAAAGATIALSLIDDAGWGSIQLPSLDSPWRWEVTLFAGAAPWLTVVALLVVNGVIIPVAEEWLWRGLIQPRLIGAIGLLGGLLLTSVLFSLKHALVDASLGRLLALTGFGLVVGLLAARRGWRASALAHVITNSAFTLLVVLAGGGPA